MDWRERKYYLVRLNDSLLDWWHKGHDDYGIKYNNSYNMIKNKIPSIKISEPYNHFKFNDDKYSYDGHLKEIGYIQFMISCRKEYCELFEEIISEIKAQDDYVVCKEITREMCGQ